MTNAEGEATGIWLGEGALTNNLFGITFFDVPDLKCTLNINGSTQTFNAMLPSRIFDQKSQKQVFNYFFEGDDWPYSIVIDLDDKGNPLITFEKRPLFINPDEGKNGVIFSRSREINSDKIKVVCEKYSPETRSTKEINYKEQFLLDPNF
jgi:hypothetical protein